MWTGRPGRLPMAALKKILLGKPLSSADEHHQRLSKKIALPVFASDAISSTAYATDEILVVLVLQAGVGLHGLRPLVPIAIVVVRPAGDRRHVVPPDDPRLPDRWRRLHREPREPRRRSRRSSPARRCSSTTSSPWPCRVAGGVLRDPVGVRVRHRVDGPALPRCASLVMTVAEPARREGVRARSSPAPTYFYILMLVDPDRHRPLPHLRPARRPDPVETSVGGGDRAAAGRRGAQPDHAAAGVLVRRRRRCRASRPCRTACRRSRSPSPRTRPPRSMWMGAILGTCFFGVSVLASHLKPYRGENDGNGLGLMAEYIYGGKGVLFWLTQIAHVLHPDPGRQHRLRRLPPPRRRSSPRTASCPASSPTAATASCSRTACCSSRSWPAS